MKTSYMFSIDCTHCPVKAYSDNTITSSQFSVSRTHLAFDTNLRRRWFSNAPKHKLVIAYTTQIIAMEVCVAGKATTNNTNCVWVHHSNYLRRRYVLQPVTYREGEYQIPTLGSSGSHQIGCLTFQNAPSKGCTEPPFWIDISTDLYDFNCTVSLRTMKTTLKKIWMSYFKQERSKTIFRQPVLRDLNIFAFVCL